MDAKVLKDALRRRRGRDFDPEKFKAGDAEPGIDSQDLLEKESVVMGEGVPKKEIEKVPEGRSTDELAPSKKEMGLEDFKPFKDVQKSNFGEVSEFDEMDDIREVSGSADDAVLSEFGVEAERAMRRKPRSLTDRMLQGLGRKMRK